MKTTKFVKTFTKIAEKAINTMLKREGFSGITAKVTLHRKV